MSERARLTVVEFWPSTGFAGGVWLPDPDADALVKSARRVCELYGDVLDANALQLGIVRTRFVIVGRSDGDQVHIRVPASATSKHVEVAVSVPAGIHRWDGSVRAAAAMGVIDSALRHLARKDPDALAIVEVAQLEVLRRGLAFWGAGEWVTSPSGRIRARAAYEILDNGSGRVQVELQDADVDPDAAPLVTTAFGLGNGTRQNLRRDHALSWEADSLGGTLRALDMTGVNGPVEPLRWSTLSTLPVGRRDMVELVDVTEAVEAASLVTLQEEDPYAVKVRFGGGMSAGKVSDAYETAFRVMGQVLEPELVEWWRPVGGLLDFGYWISDADERISTRRRNAETRVELRRPTSSLTDLNGARLAEDDVRRALLVLAKKYGLSDDLPGFPFDTLEDDVREILTKKGRFTARVRSFLLSVRDLLPPDIFDQAIDLADDYMEVMGWIGNHLDPTKLNNEQRQTLKDLQSE